MFSKVEPWEPDDETDAAVRQAFVDFANDNMVDPAPEGDTEGDNPTMPAGYTYFGQFVDHDITFDPTTSLMRHNDPNKHRNFRTPRLDLDSVYGGGPDATPHLYSDRFGFFLIGHGVLEVEPDLPRNTAGTALIGDPRNDENIIVSQLQLAFLLFHNAVLGEIVGDDATPATHPQFRRAQKLVRWTYQYIVWNDFVNRLVSTSVFEDVIGEVDKGVLKARRLYYAWKQDPYIPVEFSVAAYRLGHAMVRNAYQINISTALGFGVHRPIFSMDGSADLRGGRPLPPGHTVQWDWFFQLPSSAPGIFPQFARKFNPLISQGLQAIPTPDGPTPLAVLNLMRSWRLDLPGGRDVAEFMALPPMDVTGVEDCLWIYILKEAEMEAQMGGGGTELGSVGSRIVAEVFAGLLLGDPSSFFSVKPEWKPDNEAELRAVMGSDPVNADWEVADIVSSIGVPLENADFADINTALSTIDLTDPSLVP